MDFSEVTLIYFRGLLSYQTNSTVRYHENLLEKDLLKKRGTFFNTHRNWHTLIEQSTPS